MASHPDPGLPPLPTAPPPRAASRIQMHILTVDGDADARWVRRRTGRLRGPWVALAVALGGISRVITFLAPKGTLYSWGREDDAKGDFAGARLHYESAAEKGHVRAMCRLGEILLHDGEPVQARQWWERAAAQGDTRARDHLAALDGWAMPGAAAEASVPSPLQPVAAAGKDKDGGVPGWVWWVVGVIALQVVLGLAGRLG